MKKILYYILLIVPFIDLITSVGERYVESIISIGTIFKSLLLVGCYIYVFFITKSKHKRKSIIYYTLIPIYALLYFIFKDGMTNYLLEINTLVKFFFFPIVLVFLYNYNDDYKIKYNEIVKLLKYSIFFMCISILAAYLTNTGFDSYYEGGGLGAIGWYFAANEVGTILTILFPFVLREITSKKLFNIIPIIIVTFTMLIIGTKTSYFGLLIPIVLMLIHILFKERSKSNIAKILVLLIIVLLLSPNSAVINNIKIKNNSSAADLVFSARQVYLLSVSDIYMESDFDSKFLGIGFTNREEISNYMVEKDIEMDFYDIFYRYGILGTIIYFYPMMSLILYMMQYVFLKFKKYDITIMMTIYSTAIGFLIALIAGHTFSAPFASLYLAIVMILFVIKIKDKNENVIRRKNENSYIN